jgi:hypothetical protein
VGRQPAQIPINLRGRHNNASRPYPVQSLAEITMFSEESPLNQVATDLKDAFQRSTWNVGGTDAATAGVSHEVSCEVYVSGVSHVRYCWCTTPANCGWLMKRATCTAA